ncbi:matrix metalloproteinase-16-like isoform X2 [Adelges cooleyi]|uniref:matrix metalloproteinase-16-like isoform X2 n=1 Tax=Adelges cooleyi TaxID=133065 RepID=UPI00218018ED|nr:matrix metalloproteinase-16-like isoform X2 [Adelges cooleyi]
MMFSYINKINCLPINRSDNINQETLEFMQKYGYLDQNGPQALSTSDSLISALKLVQKFGGLEETGNINSDTLKLIKSKRCGVTDVSRSLDHNYVRSKRFAASSSGWNKQFLTYYISNVTPKLSREGVKDEIQRAFQMWGPYSRLNFSETQNNKADIIISFSEDYHGDQFPFDGPGNVLAHAYYPTDYGSLGGDIHFDSSENWTLSNIDNNINEGVNFYSVAIHEMGHSLGLGHSSESDSIMNPYYKGPTPQEIGYDDIMGMYSLYVKKSMYEDRDGLKSTRRPISVLPNKPHVHWTSFSEESCTDDDVVTPESITTPKPIFPTRDRTSDCKGNFDAISCFRGQLFVFKKDWLWRLREPGMILPRYPVKLLTFFNLFTENDANNIRIDAAYERPDSNIVMFSGNKYYVFNGNHLIEDSPRSIMDYKFPYFIKKVDAVMVYGTPPLTYLFSGEYFWIYDDQNKKLLQIHRYIKEHFRGVKTPIDDVLTWKSGEIYFFKGNQYWKYNRFNNRTEVGYPKNASEFVFGSIC